MVAKHRLTSEDENRLDKSSNHVSAEERQELDEAESSFRKRMREKMK